MSGIPDRVRQAMMKGDTRALSLMGRRGAASRRVKAAAAKPPVKKQEETPIRDWRDAAYKNND